MTKEYGEGKYMTTIAYDGTPQRARIGPTSLATVQDAIHVFFYRSPWAFWGFDGPGSLVMPRSSSEPYCGNPKATLISKSEVLPLAPRREDSRWPEVSLPELQPFSTLSQGPFIDQLRLELTERGALAVKSPNAKAKHNRKYAFYLAAAEREEHLMTITDSTGVQDAARQVLGEIRKIKRKRNGSGK